MDEFLAALYLDMYNYLRALTVTFGSLRLQEWLAFLPLIFPPMLLEVTLEVIYVVVVVIWYLVSSLYVSSHALRGKVVPGAVFKISKFSTLCRRYKKGQNTFFFFLFLQINTF